jgi:hypothetical protein
MASAKLSKISFNKSTSTINFATEEYLNDFLEMLRAESHLPIKKVLAILHSKEVDTISCSKEDTSFSFFASQSRNGITIIVKKLGEETIEFNIPENQLGKFILAVEKPRTS